MPETMHELKRKATRALRRTPQTASEVAKRMGAPYTGRGIGRALGQLVDDGHAIKNASRVPTYVKPKGR